MKKIIKDRKALANIAGEELIIYIIGTAREFINDEFVDVVDYEYLRDGNWEFDVERKDKVEIIKYLYDPKKNKYKFKDVRFTKCEEYFRGDYKTFWKANYKPDNIKWVTLTSARTKAECMKRARKELKHLNEDVNEDFR